MEPCSNEEAAVCGALICRPKAGALPSRRMRDSILDDMLASRDGAAESRKSSDGDSVVGDGADNGVVASAQEKSPTVGEDEEEDKEEEKENRDFEAAHEFLIDEQFHETMKSRFGEDKWLRMLRAANMLQDEEAQALRQGNRI